METEHQDDLHHPGTLPGCPACDLMEAHETWKEIKRGKRCPLDVLNDAGLDQSQRRLVETAMRAEEEAESKAIPVIDVLHGLNMTQRVRAQVADWVDPDNAHQFRGSREERDVHRHAAEQRERDRRDDRVLEICAQLDMDDHGPTARHVRETAASIRDHREARHRRKYYEHHDAEEAALDQARRIYAERDAVKAEAQSLNDEAESMSGTPGKADEVNELWRQASELVFRMQSLSDQADVLVHQAIEDKRQAKWHEEQADAYGRVNRAYESSEIYRLDRQAEKEEQR